MTVFQTLAVAFSMYSAVPMPQFDWTPKNMRYAMAAFPLVGVLCGAAVFLWGAICMFFGFNTTLTGVGLCLAPVLVTGGIHLDGLCDTIDALASHAPRERKLEILKDSHAGAFAIIGVCCYLLFFCAVCTQLPLTWDTLYAMGLVFLFSRAASGLAVAWFPCAKDSGLVYAFQDAAAKKRVRVLLALWLVAVTGLLVLAQGLVGLSMAVAGAALFGCYYAMSHRIFGGITGDLAGWFLSLCELLMVFVLVAGGAL